MNSKKAMPLKLLILILLVITVIVGCGRNDMKTQDILGDFPQILEGKTLDNLRLRIYFMSPFILTRYPLSVENLIHCSFAQEIVVEGPLLEEHIDLFKKITYDVIVPVRNVSFLDARMCYIFETDDEQRILSVAFGGINSVFVNGVEVEFNDLFYDIVKPFLTDEMKSDLGIIF